MLDADQINLLLPQTQCTRCGYPDCASYAHAIAKGEAAINQCPPGGEEGIARLSRLTGQPAIPLNPEFGTEGPRHLAVIDENWCIGCTLCIKACPVDCIVGAPKHMHTVIEDQCTGCELCIPACPVDCISLVPTQSDQPAPTGWAAWSQSQADEARKRYAFRAIRIVQAKADNDARLLAKAEHKLAHLEESSRLTEPAQLDKKRATIEAALAKARARRQST
ncbi:MAG TPA: electron transport complex subunit RsxB [Aquabacterium sp.]|nr:electron transport complex subunit RsxB [Aquabacterium sp.]